MILSAYKRELIRKIIHIVTGVIFIATALIFKDIDAIFWMGAILLVPFLIFYFVVKWFSETKIGQLSHGLVEREVGHHTHGIGGLSFVLGVMLSYTLFGFNPSIVIVSIIILAFGDGFASYFGMRFGKLKFNIEGHTKTLEGTLAGIIVATAVSSIFVDFVTALVVTSLTMIIEMVGIKIRGREIPDNLYIPIIAGIIMYIFITFR
jgi:dolichol kinase